ncbi:30S ribosomal protein S17 [bacterium]|nr:30S ribosomal protein S17 [bacterium]
MKKSKAEVKVTNRRILEGVVVSNKMVKTVKVLIEYLQAHPRYKKVITKRKTYFAHTEKELKEGDKVKIKESRPYSKNVRWVVVD